MDACLIKECLKSKPKKVLDYGCGSGSTADKLAENGCEVDCYDPDQTKFECHSHKQTVSMLTVEDINKKIESGYCYDLVLCNLVLCSIETDNDVEQVFRKLRTLTSQSGQIIVGLCNPLSDEVKTSPSQIREVFSENKYSSHFAIKEITPKGNQRTIGTAQ